MSQMVEQVARLIANRLACGGDIFLPNVGSFYVVHHGAEQLSKRWIQPPYRSVDFTSQERGESLTDMIARAASCDADAARTVYDRWLEQVRKEDTLTITGVGTLTYKTFTLASEFERRLNPQGRAPMRLRRSSGVDWVLVLGMMAIVATAIVVGYYLMQEHFLRMQQPAEISIVSEPAVEETAEVVETVASDSTTVVPAPVVEPVVPTVQSSELQLLAAGRHYVVMGVFLTRENAENAVKLFAGRQSDLNYTIYRFGSRFMVSGHVSDDKEKARDFIRNHSDRFSDMWVYSAR